MDMATQFVELLSVGGGQTKAGLVPAHLSAPEGDVEPLLILTVRMWPRSSFAPHNLSLTKAQGLRLLKDLKWAFENDQLLNGTYEE
jgi:hypothetical protein